MFKIQSLDEIMTIIRKKKKNDWIPAEIACFQLVRAVKSNMIII